MAIFGHIFGIIFVIFGIVLLIGIIRFVLNHDSNTPFIETVFTFTVKTEASDDSAPSQTSLTRHNAIRLNKVHHIAVICSDYQRSLDFYTRILGLTVIAENYREARKSYKTDLALNGEYIIELFSFPEPPARLSRPEATGLRHLAFEVDDIDASASCLEKSGISHEAIRSDEYTGRRFLFFQDPDGLPIEFYEK